MNIQIVKSIRVQNSKQKKLIGRTLLTFTHILQKGHTVQTHLSFRHISAWKGFIIFPPHQSIHTTAHWQSKEHFGGEFYTVRKKVWNILLGIHIVYLILKAPFTEMTALDFLGQDLSRLTHLFTRFLPFFLAESFKFNQAGWEQGVQSFPRVSRENNSLICLIWVRWGQSGNVCP